MPLLDGVKSQIDQDEPRVAAQDRIKQQRRAGLRANKHGPALTIMPRKSGISIDPCATGDGGQDQPY